MDEEKLKAVMERLVDETEGMNDFEKETYYRMHLMEYMSTASIADAKRGKYSTCKKRKMREGFTEHEAELACSKYLQDEDDTSSNGMNLMLVDDSLSPEECVKKKIPIFAKEHPDWSHEKHVAAAHGYCGLSKQGDARPLGVSINTNLAGIIKRSKSLDLSRFSTLIKAIKTRQGLKVGAMGILPEDISLPMKNLNRLQTKMEKTVTAESKNLTMEQYEQRKNYARYMRKQDSDEIEMDDEEFAYALRDLYDSIVDYYPALDPLDAIDKAFERPSGDNAWIMSNESEIISMNDGMKNIIKAPIILAKELIQPYRDAEGNTEYHFKPYEELQLAAERAKDEPPLDIIIEHQEWYDEDNIMGYVKNIRADDSTRKIRGMGYFYENRLPDGLKQMIKDGIPIPVSIGFLAKLGDGGEWNGQKYDHAQTNIILRHLAICLDSIPRCPADVCGINLKDSESGDVKIFRIIKDENYYYNICNIFNDSTEETTKNNTIKNLEINMIQEDSMDEKHKKGEIAGDEPDDLEAILKRLRMLLHGTVETENATSRILEALGLKQKSDNEMDEKQFQEALQMKDSEKDKVLKELEDAQNEIKKFRESEKKRYIETILRFDDSKYTKEELEVKNLDSLAEIADAVSRFAPSNEKAIVLPVAGRKDKKEMEDAIGKAERVDPYKLFDDVNKEYNMSGF